MKKISVIITLLLGLCTMNTQAQYLNASLPEAFNPNVANIALNPTKTNCHSYGSLANTATSDLYDVAVNTYEGYNSLSPLTLNWGFAWACRNLTTSAITVNYLSNPAPSPGLEMKNMDIGILQSSTNEIIIAVSFMDPATGYYVAFYELNPNANTATFLNLQSLGSGTSTVSGTNMDVNNKTDFIITFEDAFKIFAVAGQVGSGTTITLGSVNDINIGTAANRPDVALCRSSSGLNAHFVYRKFTGGLEESMIDFNTIFTSTSSLSQIVEDAVNPAFYDYPRIDCPDNVSDDSWSYVMMQNNHEIFASVKTTAGINYYLLNNGSVPPLASDLTAFKNLFPVVAYDADPNLIHYSWAVDAVTNFPVPTSKGYLGVTLKTSGIVLSPDYWLMENNLLDNATSTPSVALSGQNDASPELFSALTYLGAASPFDSYIKCKITPWSNFGFKPTGITSLSKEILDAKIVPNPTLTGFSISIHPNVDPGKCHLIVTDITGRKLLDCMGSFAQVNLSLQHTSKGFKSGIYAIALSSDQTKEQLSFSAVKQ